MSRVHREGLRLPDPTDQEARTPRQDSAEVEPVMADDIEALILASNKAGEVYDDDSPSILQRAITYVNRSAT